jgi:hypothetical protein
VYIWSCRDTVSFKGNKVVSLGYSDHDQRVTVSQEEAHKNFISALYRMANRVAPQKTNVP